MTRSRATIQSPSADFTEELGHALGRAVRAGDTILLDGPLGAGKTCLTRGVAAGLGLEPRQVSSPTFVIINQYTQPAQGVSTFDVTPLAHADAYRLQSAEDLDSLGWDRVTDGSGVVVIEWAARLRSTTPGNAPAVLDSHSAAITLTPEGDELRRIDLDLPIHWLDRRNAEALARLMAGDRCRVCGNRLPANGTLGPFCSQRCRTADLGGWLTGKYVISRPADGAEPEPDADRGTLGP